MNFTTIITKRNISNLKRNKWVKIMGFKCHKCGKEFRHGQTIVIHGHRTRRHYCLKCAKELGLYPIIQEKCS